MASTTDLDTPPFAYGDKVTTTFALMDNMNPDRVYSVVLVRRFKYAATGWMVTVDSDEVPEADSRWFHAA